MKKLLVVLIALMLILTQACAEDTSKLELARVEDTVIFKAQADEIMPSFVSYNYVSTETDYQTVVEYLVQQEVMRRKIADMKFNEFSQEELDSITKDAEAELNSYIENYIEQNISEDTQEARDKAHTQAEEFFTTHGLTLDVLVDSVKQRESFNKMTEYLLAGYAPTEQEVQQIFETVGQQYQEQYANNIPLFEGMTTYYGQPKWYTPEGYRGIIHILIKVDEDILEQYMAMQAAYEEQQNSAGNDSAEEPNKQNDSAVVTEPVTLEQVEVAKQAVLDSKKDIIDTIYDRLADGESFEKLIEEFGSDPGMLNTDNLRDGYPVHKESIVYDPAFTSAAFSDRMNRVGDVSEPSVGSFGVHILKYQRDVPSGLIMTDAIYSQISEALLIQKETEVLDSALSGWMAEMNINYNDANIELATKEAHERITKEQSDDKSEAPLEAVPAESEGN